MRYAIYFVPDAASSLWRFGSNAIGYDSVAGAECDSPPIMDIADDVARDATSEPRRYGFHGTLKPPFELAGSMDIAGLERTLRHFAVEQTAFLIPSMKVMALGRFLALVPAVPSADLIRLAGDCVTAFEPFRAPLSEADRARRLSRPLTARQLAYVDAWGYPYVFEEFRFHMTLTGPLDDGLRAPFLTSLADRYAEIDAPVGIDAVALCVQTDRSARFRLMRRFPFGRA